MFIIGDGLIELIGQLSKSHRPLRSLSNLSILRQGSFFSKLNTSSYLIKYY
ncbi:MAG: hypothetical protein KME05_16890 [Gloeocapsa sp. UFS-A4-WI-NPMV-4B04]|nr:hypothetical protein [Gloeocapsa sp. UFS-A4-WI-NPMV-4B04]